MAVAVSTQSTDCPGPRVVTELQLLSTYVRFDVAATLVRVSWPVFCSFMGQVMVTSANTHEEHRQMHHSDKHLRGVEGQQALLFVGRAC